MMGYAVGGYGMGGFGFFGILIYAVLVVVPFWRLLPRFGIPAPVALVALFPVGAVILLWVMAFREEVGGGAA